MPVTGSKSSANYKSIRLATDGLSFYGEATEQIRFSHPDTHYLRSMSHLLCSPSVPQHLECIWLSINTCQLLPTGLFNNVQTDELLAFQFPDSTGGYTTTEELQEGASLAYSLPANLKEFLDEQFPGTPLRHCDSALLSQLACTTAQQQQRALWIHPQGDTCSLAWADCGRIRFYNRFPCTHEDDLLYYTAAVLRSVDCAQAEVEATLWEYDQYREALAARLPKLTFQPLPPCAL